MARSLCRVWSLGGEVVDNFEVKWAVGLSIGLV